MAKFRITDNQTGRQMVVEGDRPPTPEEALALFEQPLPKATTEATPMGEVKPTTIPAEGLLNFLAGGSVVKTGKMIGTGIKQRLTSGSADKSIAALQQQSRQAIEMAKRETDPQKKSNLLQTSRDIDAQVAQATQNQYGNTEQEMGYAPGESASIENDKLEYAKLGLLNVLNTGMRVGAAKTAVNLGKNVIGARSIDPFKVTGYAKKQVLGDIEKAGTKIDGKDVFNSLVEKIKTTTGTTRQKLEEELAKEAPKLLGKSGKGKQLAVDLVDKIKSEAWKQSRSSATDKTLSGFNPTWNRMVQSATKDALMKVAPELNKYDAFFKLLYGAKRTVPWLTGMGILGLGLKSAGGAIANSISGLAGSVTGGTE